MKRPRLVSIFSLSLTLIFATGAQAQTSGLIFDAPGTLAVKSSEALPAPQVCNVSGTDIKAAPRISVGDLSNAAGEPAPVLTAQLDDSVPWVAGNCRPVTLTSVAKADLPDGTYTGTVTVISAVGGARLLVEFAQEPEIAPNTAPAQAAVDTAKLTATRGGPWTKASLDGDSTLPVKAPPAGLTIALPACEAAGRCFAGNVYNGTHSAKVFLSDAQPDNRAGKRFNPVQLELELEGAGEIGEYSGALDLAGTPADPADDIKITVTVTDCVWAAIVALVLSLILFALVPQLILRRMVPKHRLESPCDDFDTGYTTAVAAFNRSFGADWKAPAETRNFVKAIKDGVRKYGRSTVYFDSSSDAYKEIERTVTRVQDDTAFLEEGLAEDLATLEAKLEELTTFVNEHFHRGMPRFAVGASALLKPPKAGGRLKVGQATAIGKEARAATALMSTWQGQAEKLLGYERWATRLGNDAIARPATWPESDMDRLRSTISRVIEVGHELLDIEDAEDLDDYETASDLKRIYGNLAYLSGLHDGWRSADATMDDRFKTTFNIAPMPGVVGLTLEALFAVAPDIGARSAQPAVLRDGKGIVAGAIAFGLTLVTAGLAALSAFYFGKPWGTTGDYVTVIVGATAASALLQSAVEGLGKLLPAAPKQVIKEPVGSILEKSPAPAVTSTS